MFIINKKTQEISEKHNKESTQTAPHRDNHIKISKVFMKIQTMYKVTGK